jgi:hypothetical protein
MQTKGGTTGSSGRAGGGGSFNEDGAHYSNGQSGGQSFMKGCVGGLQLITGCDGGFGGGGGAQYEGGGGGGFNGGSVCDCNAYSSINVDRGATSYCSGNNPMFLGLNQDLDGYVLFE